MDIDLLCAMAGIDIVQVAYRGESQVLTDVVGGQLTITISSFNGIDQLTATGKVRPLAVTSAQRAPQFPDVPTVGDTVPGYEMDGWYGLAAPAGTPASVIALLERETAAVLANPDIARRITERGFEVAGFPADRFAKVIAADYAKYGKLIRDRGIKAE